MSEPWGPQAHERSQAALTEERLSELRSRKIDLIAYLRGGNPRGIRLLLNARAVWRAKPPAEERRTRVE